MFAVIFLAAFESLAVTTVMPLVADDLDGQSLFAMAFAVPLAAGVIGLVTAGNWSDRAGPLRPLVAATALFVVGIVIAGTAVTMEVFVVGRFVHGLGGAAVTVPLYVIVGRVYPPALRARVFAGFAAAWVIPSIIGPAIAGFVAVALSWHWVFLGVIALLIPAGAMMLPPLLRVRTEVEGDPSVAWSASRLAWAALAASAALTLGLAKEFDEPWRWIAAATAVVVAVIAVRPLLPPGTLVARRGMPATVLIRALIAAAFFGTEIYLPKLFIEQYHFDPPLAGAILTGAGISWAAASWLQGRLPRLAHATVARIASVALAVALAAVLAVAALALAPVIAFAAWTLAGAAMGFMYPRTSVAVLEQSAVSAQGFNSAALSIGESLAASVSLAVTALVASAVAGGAFTAEFAVTVAIAVIAVLVAPRMRPRGGVAVGA